MIQKLDSPCLINFDSIGNTNLGYITIAQKNERMPFEVKRVYWTYYTPHHVIRGNHAHHKLEQLIFAVSGVIDFELENNKGQKFNFKLDKPDVALYIPPMHWRVIKFSHSAVLLCLASEEYRENDYIRDYNHFRNILL
jgi:dTDP-4-dehydrorhamnose 3,5-epimerase-like enzyme